MEVLPSTEAPMVAGQKKWVLLKQEKESSLISLTQYILSQMLVLKCCSKVMAIICEDQYIKTQQLHSSLVMCKGSVSDIIQGLGYWKVYTKCVPLNLTVKNKTNRKAICSKLLVCFEAEGETCLSWGVTANESWVHHSRNKEGNPPNSTILNLPGRKNSKIPPSVDKAMTTVCMGL
jgi:hypothetical protein